MRDSETAWGDFNRAAELAHAALEEARKLAWKAYYDEADIDIAWVSSQKAEAIAWEGFRKAMELAYNAYYAELS